MRARVLRRDEYMCRECKRYGKRVTAATVHHIRPREQYPELAYVTANLISLCEQCHNAMHNRHDNTLTVKGLELVARTPLPKAQIDSSRGTEGQGAFQ